MLKAMTLHDSLIHLLPSSLSCDEILICNERVPSQACHAINTPRVPKEPTHFITTTMTKPKASSKGRPEGQRTLDSFFKGNKKKESEDTQTSDEDGHETDAVDIQTNASEPEPSDASDGETLEDEGDVSETEGEDVPESTKEKTAAKNTAPDASDLPPINDISEIFDDLVSRAPAIKGVAEHIQGRKLRVATMCSGTESPLLALELIQKALKEQHGLDIPVEHVFSCEIEPFKQAYIERNFQPPLLFRDVCELGDGEAYVSSYTYTYVTRC
jgi:hypothetical protein